MAMPYVGLYMEAEDGAALDFRKLSRRRGWQLLYTPAPDALTRARLNDKFVAPALPLVLIEGSSSKDEVILHPTMLDANSPNFLGPRHELLETVTLVGFGFGDTDQLGEVTDTLARLPTGFVHSPYRGLGLNYDLRQVIDTATRAKGVTDLRIAKGLRGEPVVKLPEIHERLAGVTIECLPYADVIRRYDAAETLFYLDPPYWNCEKDYGDGFERADFERLADQLGAIAGKFILSINDTPGARAVFARFNLSNIETTYTVGSSSAGAGKRVGELIIRN